MTMSRVEVKISATISGSFNKHLDQIQNKILEFQQEGIEVLSPKLSRPISCEDEFVRLETDKGTPGEIEFEHLEAITRSDFLYVVNPGGYIGKSVALEIGYALSRNIPVYSLEKPEDNVLSFFVKPEKSVKIIKRLLMTKRDEISFTKKSLTLTDLQNYVRDMVKRRGFEKETTEDVLLLLVEEIGELARAIRDLKGLKVGRKSENVYKNLREELADCLIYLLDIANLADVNLEGALREKEKLNSARKWRSRKV
jgi:NTP pyrophosphatase (non-canonical NTP hydrolase)